MRVLTVTAVAAERDAVGAEGAFGAGPATAPPPPERVPLPGGYELLRRAAAVEAGCFDALAAGVGPAAAAAGTATALTAAALRGEPYDLVISAGIGGGFTAGVCLVVADAVVAADLGAESTDGFLAVTELGFGVDVHRPPPGLVRAVAEATGAHVGPVLTVSTVTGTAERAAALAARHTGAAAEAMEGFGVAEAAAAHGVPMLEIRATSNAVGPRDRAAWRIPDALRALAGAFAALPPVLDAWNERS